MSTPPPSDQSETRRLLRTYLRDHDAGELAGSRRLGATAEGHRDPGARAELARLHDQVEQDRKSLAAVMARLDVTPDPVKRLATLARRRRRGEPLASAPTVAPQPERYGLLEKTAPPPVTPSTVPET